MIPRSSLSDKVRRIPAHGHDNGLSRVEIGLGFGGDGNPEERIVFQMDDQGIGQRKDFSHCFHWTGWQKSDVLQSHFLRPLLKTRPVHTPADQHKLNIRQRLSAKPCTIQHGIQSLGEAHRPGEKNNKFTCEF